MGTTAIHPARASRPALLITLGALTFLGIVSMIASDVFGSLNREGYHPLAQTISLLARHRGNLAQDIGLYLLGAGTLAAGAGLALMIWDGLARRILVVLVLIAGVDVFVLTAFDVLVGTFPHADQIHIVTTWILALLVVTIAFLFAALVRRRAPGYARWSAGAGVVGVALAPVYFLVPTGWNGLVERLLALTGLVVLGVVGWALVRRDTRIQSAD